MITTNINKLKKYKYLITGGTGSFGQKMIEILSKKIIMTVSLSVTAQDIMMMFMYVVLMIQLIQLYFQKNLKDPHLLED